MKTDRVITLPRSTKTEPLAFHASDSHNINRYVRETASVVALSRALRQAKDRRLAALGKLNGRQRTEAEAMLVDACITIPPLS